MARGKNYVLILVVLAILSPWSSVWAQTNCTTTLDAGPDVILCEGNQTISLAAQVSGDFLDILWTPASGLSAPMQALTQANIDTSIIYMIRVRSLSGSNLIVNGDFSQGDFGFTSNYEYGTGGSFGLLSTEGQYAIDDDPEDTHRRFASCGDHTTGNGNMMVVNASGEEDNFWCQTVAVNEGTLYDFSAWVASVNEENPAQLRFSIDGAFLGDQFNSSGDLCDWEEFSAQWTATATASVEICVVNVNLTPAGNDFAIDDLAFQEVCVATDSVVVTVADLIADWQQPAAICQNDDLIILDDLLLPGATPGGIWLLAGEEVASLDPSKLNAGQYQLSYNVSLATCSEQQAQTITILKAPYAGAPGPTLNYCQGTNLSLQLIDQLMGEDAGGVWTETSLSGSAGNAFNANSGSLQVAGLAAGNYTFNYAVGAGGPCGASENEVRVIIDPLPAVDLGPDRNLDCVDTDITLAPAGGSNNALEYEWTGSDGTVLGTTAALSVAMAGTYQLMVTNSTTGCQAQDAIAVSENRDSISATLAIIPPTCYDSKDGRIQVQSAAGGTEPYMYSINNGPFISSPDFGNLSAGNYELTVMDAGGCVQSLNATVIAPSQLQVVIASDNNVLNLGDSLELEVIINNPVSQIKWTPAQPNCPNCSTITIAPVVSTRYLVEVIDEFGCSASAQLEIQVKREFAIFVPNAFSPNGDGVNDVFFVNAGEGIHLMDIEIADRWGNIVFQRKDFPANDLSAAWDGRVLGNLVPSGVMVYSLKAALPNGEVIVLSGELAVVY